MISCFKLGLSLNPKEEKYSLDMMMNIQLIMNETLIEILHIKIMNNLMRRTSNKAIN